MKKLLFASLFYGVYLSGMGMGDPETLRVLGEMLKNKKKNPPTRISMDVLEDNCTKNYHTINDHKEPEKKEVEETNWRSFFLAFCCIPQDNQ